jgi:5-methylcytosine-specific restriction endonuclease McrA
VGDVINRPVLVLNRHWLAVHICSVRRALSLLYQGLAQVVADNYQTFDFDSWRELSRVLPPDDDLVRAPGFQFRVPAVIVLQHYQKCPPRTVRFNRRNIYVRDRFRCQYCGDSPGRDQLTIDHVVPRSKGGRSTWNNVVVACVQCNSEKGDRLPSEWGMAPRVAPKRPSWFSAFRMVPGERERSTWERFVDAAQWETKLAE